MDNQDQQGGVQNPNPNPAPTDPTGGMTPTAPSNPEPAAPTEGGEEHPGGGDMGGGTSPQQPGM